MSVKNNSTNNSDYRSIHGRYSQHPNSDRRHQSPIGIDMKSQKGSKRKTVETALNFSQQHNAQGGLFSPRAELMTPLSYNSYDMKKSSRDRPAGLVPKPRIYDDECVSEIGKNMRKQALKLEKRGSKNPGKKSLHMYDFKKFKVRKNVQSIYKFGKVIGQGAFG